MLEDWPSRPQQDPLHWVALIQAQLQQMYALNPSAVLQSHLRNVQVASDALLSLLTPAGAEQSVQQAEQTPGSGASGQESPLRLLLVEDNPFTQKLMSRLLTMRAQHIAVASQGEEALPLLQAAAAQGQPFNMVLMDIRMPGMDGYETTLAIRQWEAHAAQPRIPIIAVTVLNDDADRQRAKQVGMDGFHCKPVQANQLFAEMEQLLLVSGVENPCQDGTECALDIGLNMESLLKTVENDWGLLGEIVDLYQIDAPKQLQRIQDGIQRQDPDLVREAAHSLKGASGAFGKSTLSFALAYQLEQAGRNRDLGQAHELLHQLRQAIVLMEQALRAELHKHSSL